MKTKRPILNYILNDERWTHPPLAWEENISESLEKAAGILENDFSSQEVSVVLSNDKEVQALNKTFRHKDKPTNVLSFPSDLVEELGDIILAYETVMKEATESHIPLLNHTRHLIIHGFLHLLGYDHEEEKEAEKMEAMEIKILKSLNIKNPYEAA